MRFRSLPVVLTLAAAGVAAFAADAPPATSERSTGNTQTTVAPAAPATPPAPQTPVRAEFETGKTRKLVEGKVRKGSPAIVLWAAPQNQMLSAELVGADKALSLVVYQPDAKETDGGTKPEDGAIRWIGASGKSGDLRFEVHSTSDAELAFKLGLEAVPPLGHP
jgi:hypothetical protein